MNDFSELENDLGKLRPLPPSAGLFARVERAMTDPMSVDDVPANVIRPNLFRLNWASLGIALAAAAVLLIFAHLDFNRPAKTTPEVASISPGPSAATTAAGQFIPAGATQVVYHTRDEGLHFANGSDQPVRRLRSLTRETWQWRNPATGASLRVSYPTEQIELIPVSGQ